MILRHFDDPQSDEMLRMTFQLKTFWSIIWTIQNIVFCFATVATWQFTEEPLIASLKIDFNETHVLVFECISQTLILMCSFLFVLREINVFVIRFFEHLSRRMFFAQIAIVLIFVFVIMVVVFSSFKLLFLISLTSLFAIQLIFTIGNVFTKTLLFEEFLLTDCFRVVPIIFVWLFLFGLSSPCVVISILIAHDIQFALINLFQNSAINGRIFTVIN